MASCNSNSTNSSSSTLGHTFNNPKRSRRVIYCPHCLRDVPKSTYYRHRAEFYDEVAENWLLSRDSNVSTDNTLSSLPLSSQGKLHVGSAKFMTGFMYMYPIMGTIDPCMMASTL